MTQSILLWCLLLCLVGEAVLAVMYLRSRKLSLPAYLGWGVVIVFVPLLGPFLAIACRPGEALSVQ